MNKFFNALLFLLFFPTLVLALVVRFDIPLPFFDENLGFLEHTEFCFLLLGLCFFILGILRSSRRWIAMHLVNKQTKFRWTSPVSSSRIRRVYTYLFLENGFMLVLACSLFWISSQAYLPALALFLASIDGVFFAFWGDKKHKFRIGLSSKALLACDREVIVIYFTGLRQISMQQQTFFFDFKEKEMQFRLPINFIPPDKQHEFIAELKEILATKRIYFPNNLPH